MTIKTRQLVISSVQMLSCVQLFVTLWTAALQASLSITKSWSLLKIMFIESGLPFHTVHGFLKARILKWFALPFSRGQVLSELSTMTHPSWVAPHSMAHCFTELHKAVDVSLSKLQETVKDREACHATVHGRSLATAHQQSP